jgi:hypothetical protein
MTCLEMDEVISSGLRDRPLDPRAARHLAECEVCYRLIHILDEGARTPIVGERLVRQIQGEITENLKAVRPLPASRFFLFACGIILLIVVAVGAMPFGMNGWANLTSFQRVGVFATLTLSATLLTLSMVAQMVPGGRQALKPGAVPVLVLSTLVAVIAIMFRPREDSGFMASGIACIRNGLANSIPAVFVFWLLLRRGAILYPKLIGAAAGTLAGLAGFTVLELNCPNVNVFHVLVWHCGVVLISTGAGTLLGGAAEYLQRSGDRKAL